MGVAVAAIEELRIQDEPEIEGSTDYLMGVIDALHWYTELVPNITDDLTKRLEKYESHVHAEVKRRNNNSVAIGNQEGESQEG